MNKRIEDILIFTKTYPMPSLKYRETTCVAACDSSGKMLRLYPVPFRLMDGDQQFKKWEWIRAEIIKAKDDYRPESYKINPDSVQRTRSIIPTKNDWAERLNWLRPHIVNSFTELELRRQTTKETLGFIRPNRLLGLDITPIKEIDWTEDEKYKLMQDGLFDTEEIKTRALLRKVPFNFHYRYECVSSGRIETHRHMITDWEVGALYFNCQRSHGQNWETPFRQKLEEWFSKRDLIFLMGTVHRFPDQWLIVGLVYPPMPKLAQENQLSLF